MKRLMGVEWSKKILSKKYIKQYQKSDIIFIHIPKAAGTSIANEIYGKRNGHLTASQVVKILGKDEFNRKFSFSISRNPYDRLVSSYFYAVQGGSIDGGITNSSMYKTNEFSDFSSFVKNWLVFQDLNSIDLIFRPQYLVCHSFQFRWYENQ